MRGSNEPMSDVQSESRAPRASFPAAVDVSLPLPAVAKDGLLVTKTSLVDSKDRAAYCHPDDDDDTS